MVERQLPTGESNRRVPASLCEPGSRLRTVTLGCKVNQYETEWVREGLISAGYCDAEVDDTADLCIVNTCTVTATGDAKSRQVIRRLARDNPESRIVVMGCYATRAPDEVAALPQVVEVVEDKRELPDLLGRLGVIDIPNGISRFGDRQRAYVKIQDGCLLRCSYCVIPLVRPQMVSRDHDEIVAEVSRLVESGYREVVLTGIHLGHYGVDRNRCRPRDEWIRLSSLLQQLVRLPGKFRVRLSSIEATEVTRSLLQVIHDHPDRICPHLHVCMQSGSDAVLRAMRRRWGARRFADRCQLARETIPNLALTTDAIVGFPGETDDDFEQTCDLARALRFCKIHVFPFSPRRGTPAAKLNPQVDRNVQMARTRRLIAIEEELRREYAETLRGKRLDLLIEQYATDGVAVGTTCRFLPARIATTARPGEIIPIEVAKWNDGYLLGDAVAP